VRNDPRLDPEKVEATSYKLGFFAYVANVGPVPIGDNDEFYVRLTARGEDPEKPLSIFGHGGREDEFGGHNT